jgi:hypothetical protein
VVRWADASGSVVLRDGRTGWTRRRTAMLAKGLLVDGCNVRIPYR